MHHAGVERLGVIATPSAPDQADGSDRRLVAIAGVVRLAAHGSRRDVGAAPVVSDA